MKFSARITTQFNISEDDLKKLCYYASANPDYSDLVSSDEVAVIMKKVFSENEGYLPGSWLDFYAGQLGLPELQCGDLDINC